MWLHDMKFKKYNSQIRSIYIDVRMKAALDNLMTSKCNAGKATKKTAFKSLLQKRRYAIKHMPWVKRRTQKTTKIRVALTRKDIAYALRARRLAISCSLQFCKQRMQCSINANRPAVTFEQVVMTNESHHNLRPLSYTCLITSSLPPELPSSCMNQLAKSFLLHRHIFI